MLNFAVLLCSLAFENSTFCDGRHVDASVLHAFICHRRESVREWASSCHRWPCMDTDVADDSELDRIG